jgi:hypothetical protein
MSANGDTTRPGSPQGASDASTSSPDPLHVGPAGDESGAPTGSSVDLDELAERLVATYGPDPQEVGATDGTEDDFGDLVAEAADELGVDADDVNAYQDFLDVALECRSTRMRDWLEHLAAAVER